VTLQHGVRFPYQKNITIIDEYEEFQLMIPYTQYPVRQNLCIFEKHKDGKAGLVMILEELSREPN